MIWLEMLAEIKRSLKEPENRDGHWKSFELLRRANEIQREIARQTLCLKKDLSIEINPETLSFPKPSDYIKVYELIYNDKRIEGRSEKWIDNEIGTTNWRAQSGFPMFYYIDYDKIFLKYFAFAEDLVNENDKPFNAVGFLQNASQTIVDGVLYRCFLEDANPIYQEHKSNFQKGLIAIKQLLCEPDTLDSVQIVRR
jgi:hypothetical protein